VDTKSQSAGGVQISWGWSVAVFYGQQAAGNK